jgi:hypothetical protein
MPIYIHVNKILGSASAGWQWTGPSDFDREIMENG